MAWSLTGSVGRRCGSDKIYVAVVVNGRTTGGRWTIPIEHVDDERHRPVM